MLLLRQRAPTRLTKTPKSRLSQYLSEIWICLDQRQSLSVVCKLWLIWEAGSHFVLALWQCDQCHVSARFCLIAQSSMHETGHDYRISKCFPSIEQAIAIS
jgi:hypothetical protein